MREPTIQGSPRNDDPPIAKQPTELRPADPVDEKLRPQRLWAK